MVWSQKQAITIISSVIKLIEGGDDFIYDPSAGCYLDLELKNRRVRIRTDDGSITSLCIRMHGELMYTETNFSFSYIRLIFLIKKLTKLIKKRKICSLDEKRDALFNEAYDKAFSDLITKDFEKYVLKEDT